MSIAYALDGWYQGGRHGVPRACPRTKDGARLPAGPGAGRAGAEAAGERGARAQRRQPSALGVHRRAERGDEAAASEGGAEPDVPGRGAGGHRRLPRRGA